MEDSKDNILTIFIIKIDEDTIEEVQIKAEKKISDLISEEYILKFEDKILDRSLTLKKAGLENDCILEAEKRKNIILESYETKIEKKKEIKSELKAWLRKKIHIKFLEANKFKSSKVCRKQLIGLLKLCLLKEVALLVDEYKLEQLPEEIKYIMQILSNGYISSDKNIKQDIKKVLKKISGTNLINFSNYVDEKIDSHNLKKILKLLSGQDFKKINNLRYKLAKYNNYIKLFSSEFQKALKDSIFEYSVVSLIIIEREDYKQFEEERKKCPNREEKILFHGTALEPIACILTGLFRRSTEKCYQFGKGIYFTDFLDYCWYYGSPEGNRENLNIIPKLNQTFTFIAASVYYNSKEYKQVYDHLRTPGKNQINFGIAGAQTETIEKGKLDKTKFYGTEYVIWEYDQICPFLSAKLQRNEFCVIWRDDNFSDKPIYNNEFDDEFKNFLNERLKYIKQMAKFNIYTCTTSEEALLLVERKKYNKIILLSNVGPNQIGKKFVSDAREIIGSNVIVLFVAFNEDHLNWITEYQNALFTNRTEYYEEYLQCFHDKDSMKKKLKDLKFKMEKFYNVQFNFDDKFLDYPNFKNGGHYTDISFNQYY